MSRKKKYHPELNKNKKKVREIKNMLLDFDVVTSSKQLENVTRDILKKNDVSKFQAWADRLIQKRIELEESSEPELAVQLWRSKLLCDRAC